MDKKHIDLLKEHKVIMLNGNINQDMTRHIKSLLDKAIDLKIEKLSLEISSCGGDIIEAGKIFDHISNFPGTITGLVRPYAYSAAAYILQACHVRQALNNSQIQFHHARFIFISLDKFDENIKEMSQWSDNLDQVTLQRSRISQTKYEQLKRLDMPIFPQQALRYGLIDQVINASAKKQKLQKKSEVKNYDLNLTGEHDLKKFIEFLDDMRRANYPPIRIHIRAGSVMKQMVLMFYELLKQYPGHVTTIGREELTHYSSVLMLAGDTRKMLYNTKFRLEPAVIHWLSLQLPDLKSDLGQVLVKEQLHYWDQYLEHEFVSRSKLTSKRYRQMLSHDTQYSAHTASELGIINGITIPKHLSKKN